MFLLFLTYRNLKLMDALLKHSTKPTPILGIQTDSKVFMFYVLRCPKSRGMEFEKSYLEACMF
jgi:hypothetical protein